MVVKCENEHIKNIQRAKACSFLSSTCQVFVYRSMFICPHRICLMDWHLHTTDANRFQVFQISHYSPFVWKGIFIISFKISKNSLEICFEVLLFYSDQSQILLSLMIAYSLSTHQLLIHVIARELWKAFYSQIVFSCIVITETFR